MTSILAVTLYYPPHHHGGYEIACQSALRRLVARGHRAAVLTTDHRVDGALETADESVPVERSLRCYIDGDDLLRPSVAQRWMIERHNQRCLSDALAEFRPDVVSFWHMGAMSMGLLTSAVDRRLPMVSVIADDWLTYGLALDPWAHMFVRDRRFGALRSAAGRILRPIVRVPTTVADIGSSGAFLFTSSDNRARSTAASPWNFPCSAVSYLGVDRSAFSPRSSPEREWRGRLLYAGRFDERKGLATVIEALPHVPDAVLEVRGTGEPVHRGELEALASTVGVADRIQWGERLGQEQLALRMAESDAVVFPSIWPEPFGLVPLEAMTVGAPVIATGVGGSGEFLVDGWNCVTFQPGDSASLVQAISRLSTDPALGRRIVDNGFDTAEYFDAERFADVVESWHVAAAAGFRDGEPAGRDVRRELLDV